MIFFINKAITSVKLIQESLYIKVFIKLESSDSIKIFEKNLSLRIMFEMLILVQFFLLTHKESNF